MKKRERKYHTINKILKMASQVKTCIEFPHFGAHYPDACCIDGYLWDLDSGDSDGLTNGGSDPCPTCCTRTYVQDMIDSEGSITRIYNHMKFLFDRYYYNSVKAQHLITAPLTHKNKRYESKFESFGIKGW